MKKNYLLGMALIASLSFNSCTKEIVYVQDGTGVESVADGAQIITLQVENGGDGLATRAGRPLFSAEAKQSIENVKLWICDNAGKVVYVKEISEWNDNKVSTVYTTGGHGRQTTIELTDADKLAAGTYKIYAVGYSNNSDYDLTAVTEVKKTKEDEGEGKYTFSEDKINMVLPIKKEEATNKIGEEIFAGQMDLSVKTGKGFKKPIVLNRQVAGAFAYVKDIPFMAGAKYLKLVASAQNQSLVLGHFNSVDLTGNGSENTGNVKYVVNGENGKSGNETYEISSIDLTQWFTNIADNDGDNLIDAGDNWKNPYSSEGHPTFQKGSVFGGEFVIPFAHVDGQQTLTLQLTNEGGTVLRSWKVNLSLSDEQLAQRITCWNSASTDWSTEVTDESANIYSLVRNHLYGIGTRMNDEADPENPDKDPDPEVPGETPDPDKDKPESLNNKQELVLRVNDNWEVIHGMELD